MKRDTITWKRPLGLGLAVLAAAAVVVIPTVAFAGSEAAAPKASAHAMAGHDMAVHEAALQDDLAQVRRGYGPVPRPRRGAGGRVRARVGERLRGQDHHRLRLPPHGRGDGLPLLQRGADGRSRRRPAQPEALVYAPGENGNLKLAAVEWVVRGPDSNPPGVTPPPSRPCSEWRCTSWSHLPGQPSTSCMPGSGSPTRPGCSRTGIPRSAAPRGLM